MQPESRARPGTAEISVCFEAQKPEVIRLPGAHRAEVAAIRNCRKSLSKSATPGIIGRLWRPEKTIGRLWRPEKIIVGYPTKKIIVGYPTEKTIVGYPTEKITGRLRRPVPGGPVPGGRMGQVRYSNSSSPVLMTEPGLSCTIFPGLTTIPLTCVGLVSLRFLTKSLFDFQISSACFLETV